MGRAKRPSLHTRFRLSSKPFNVTCRRAILSTHWAHRISTCFAHVGELNATNCGVFCARDKTHLPPFQSSAFSARAEAEVFTSLKIAWRFLRLTRNPSRHFVPECKPRGRGQFSRVTSFDVQASARIQLIRPRQSQHSSLDSSFIPDPRAVRKGSIEGVNRSDT